MIDINILDWEKQGGLIPTIVQDIEGNVLTLAYSSKESLAKAVENNQGWYFSRSRAKLWKKGESSGNTQELLDIKTDCDRDTLLFIVKQKGPACHLKTYSCFGELAFSLTKLWLVLRDRKENPKDDSYTSSLFTHRKGAVNKLSEKFGEEAIELILAAKDNSRDNTIAESADVLYFLLALLAEKDIPISEVLAELKKREK
jgi:phosphoribosyl-AMP cyclohydrolase / phosphoribosyl-ATP pyrophosphohydrolase